MLTDSYARAINYLRISLTDRCNLNCAYCMPAEGVQWLPHAQSLSSDEILRVVHAAARLGISKNRLTGVEPLVYPEILSLVHEIATTNTRGVFL